MNIDPYLKYWCTDTKQNFPVARCLKPEPRFDSVIAGGEDDHFLVLVADEKSACAGTLLKARPCVTASNDSKLYGWIADSGVLYAHKDRSIIAHPLRVIAWAKCDAEFDLRE